MSTQFRKFNSKIRGMCLSDPDFCYEIGLVRLVLPAVLILSITNAYSPVHVTFVHISFSGLGKFQLFSGKVKYSRVHVSFRLMLAEQFLKQTKLCFKSRKTANYTQN